MSVCSCGRQHCAPGMDLCDACRADHDAMVEAERARAEAEQEAYDNWRYEPEEDAAWKESPW